jgi:hypothetical protein
VGIIAVGLAAISAIFVMPYYPVWSLIYIAIAIMVIYGLSAHYREQAACAPGRRLPPGPGGGRASMARPPLTGKPMAPCCPQTGQVTMQIGTVSPVARSASGAHRRGNR